MRNLPVGEGQVGVDDRCELPVEEEDRSVGTDERGYSVTQNQIGETYRRGDTREKADEPRRVVDR
jgi:hypothetical protein